MKKFELFILGMGFLFHSILALAQTQVPQEKEDIWVVVKDIQGEKLEGYLRLNSNELTVSSKDNQEKSVPLKLVESIKVEKIPSGLLGVEQIGEESQYSVRLKNSHEIFTLRNKFTLSLSTSIGVMTRTIDPEMVQDFFQKDSSSAVQSKNEEPFIRDKNAILSLEVKF